jgi:GT2 family glycosyltransferase
LAEDCLKNLIQVLKTDSKLGLCAPLIKNPQTKKIIFKKGQINWFRMNTTHNSAPKKSLDYLTGCCLLVEKPVWDKLEGLNEQFFLYYEDTDLSLRAQKNGFKIKTVTSAVCFHRESSSSDSDEKTYQLVKNGLIFFHKHFSLPTRLFYFWPIFGFRLLYHTLISHKKPVAKGMKDFYLNKKNLK